MRGREILDSRGNPTVEAEVVVEAWRVESNTYRPHSVLGGLTPAEFRKAWTTEHPPAPITAGP